MTTTDPAGRRFGGRCNADRSLRAPLLTSFGVALALSLRTAGRFRHDVKEAHARLAAQATSVFRSEYGDVEYLVSGDGPPVLVSHGITGGVDQAEALVTQWRNFHPGRYRFVFVSRFGYLRSGLPHQATARTQAAAYRDLLDHLGIDRLFIVGNSAGGPSAMWFAIDNPSRTNGLILLSSAVPGPEAEYMPEVVAKHDFIYWAAIRLAPGRLLGLLLPKSVVARMTPAQRHFAIQNAFVASMPISRRTDGILFDSRTTLPSMNQIPLERIKSPTLIFQSTDDPREARGGQEMARRIPHSTLIGLTGGHFLFGHETEIKEANADFISRLTPADRIPAVDTRNKV